MKKILTLLLVSSTLMYSCNNEAKTDDAAQSGDSTSVTTPASTEVTPSADPAHPEPHTQPVSPQSGNAAASGGLNPAHGEPGHDCAIAVGAPMNSPKQATPSAQPQMITPGQGTMTPVQPQMQTTPINTQQPAAATAPGMNPAHGQPGHDCAIAVGAPLKK